MKTSIVTIVIGIFAAVGLSFDKVFAADDSTNRPFLAIWEDSEGRPPVGDKPTSPYLRIAIWNDGRIVFAKDATNWNHELLEGRIAAARMDELKKAVEKTGVFELKGNCYLVLDAPVDCVMLDFGAKQQMLYWDERESPGYGINIAPTENHLKFKGCWKEVNRLALEAVPKDSRQFTERFQRPPPSWRLKRPLQSE